MNKKNSLNYKLDNFAVLIDQAFNKYIEFQYSMIDVITDSGFFFRSINNDSGLFLDSINRDFSTIDDELIVAQYNFFLSNKKQTILRSYIKLQEIGAQLGGITQILIIIFTLVIEPLQEKKINSRLINDLFRFSKPEIKIKTIFKGPCVEADNLSKKSINSFTVTNQKSFGFAESNDQPSISLRKKINQEKIHSIVREIKNSKKLKYSKCEMILSTYFWKRFHSSKINKTDFLIKNLIDHYLYKFLNINLLFKKIREFDNIKFLLLSEDQIKIFNFLEKQEIFLNEEKFTFNSMKNARNSEEINDVKITEIIEYFINIYKNYSVCGNSIDSKLFALLPSNLRDFMFSLNK